MPEFAAVADPPDEPFSVTRGYEAYRMPGSRHFGCVIEGRS